MDNTILTIVGLVALFVSPFWASLATEGGKKFAYDFVNLSLACLTASLVTSDLNLVVLLVVVTAYYFGKKQA